MLLGSCIYIAYELTDVKSINQSCQLSECIALVTALGVVLSAVVWFVYNDYFYYLPSEAVKRNVAYTLRATPKPTMRNNCQPTSLMPETEKVAAKNGWVGSSHSKLHRFDSWPMQWPQIRNCYD